jgi:hypothetical protein
MCDIDNHAVIRENLQLACCDSAERAAQGMDAILALPRAWVLTRIQPAADPILAAGGAGEWRRMMELYQLVDATLLMDLARRAVSHPDPRIAEAGRPFLSDASS